MKGDGRPLHVSACGHVLAYLQEVKALARVKAARQTATVVGGNASSGLLRFVLALVLARILGVGEWGYLVGFMALMDVAAACGESGLHPTLVRFVAADPARDPRPIIRRALVIKAVLILLIVTVGASLGKFYLTVQRIDPAYSWLYPLAIGAGICLSVTTFGLAILQGQSRYGLYALLSVTIGLLRFLALGALVAAGVRRFSLLGGLFFAVPAAAVLVAWILVERSLRRAAGGPPGEASYREILLFMAPLAALQLVVILMMRMDVLMLQAMTNPEVVGNYGLAYQIAFAFPLVAGALVTVLLPKVAALKTMAELRTYRRRLLRLFPLVLVLTLLGMLVGPAVLTFLFGGKYQAAIPIVRLLILSFGIYLPVHPLGLVFYAVARPQIATLINIVLLALLIPLNVLLIPQLAGVGAAVANLAVNLVGVAAMIFWTGRVTRGDRAASPPALVARDRRLDGRRGGC